MTLDRQQADFELFAKAAASLLATTSNLPIKDFEQFVVEAGPAVAGRAREQLTRVEETLESLRTWWVRHDLIETLGLYHAEDPYTELLAWLIRPDTDQSTALARQQAWLNLVSPGLRLKTPAVDVRTQVITEEGIPDLLFIHDTFAIIVEAKTDSAEHETPATGKMQTIAYPDAVRRMLSQHGEPIAVFLTLDRSPAANTDAKNISWMDCALAFVRNLRADQFDATLRVLIGLALTHLVRASLSNSAIELIETLLFATKVVQPTDVQLLQWSLALQELDLAFSGKTL